MPKNTHAFPRHRDEIIADVIARLAHRGQVDKSGADYVEHPRRVARNVLEMGFGMPFTTVALLHDTVEDTDLDLDELGLIFPGGEIVEALDNLTRRTGETSEDYYKRVRGGSTSDFVNDISVAVKHADIRDNTDPERIAKLDPETRDRLTKKYEKALRMIGPVPQGY